MFEIEYIKRIINVICKREGIKIHSLEEMDIHRPKNKRIMLHPEHLIVIEYSFKLEHIITINSHEFINKFFPYVTVFYKENRIYKIEFCNWKYDEKQTKQIVMSVELAKEDI